MVWPPLIESDDIPHSRRVAYHYTIERVCDSMVTQKEREREKTIRATVPQLHWNIAATIFPVFFIDVFWQWSIWGHGHNIKIIWIECTISLKHRVRRGRDRMVVGFTTTCAISAYHHLSCEFEPCSGEVYSIQHYVIKFVSYLRQVGGFLRAIRFPSPIKTDRHNIAEILLKVALNTTNQTNCPKMTIKSLDWALNVRVGSYNV